MTKRPHQSPRAVLSKLMSFIGGFKSEAGKKLNLDISQDKVQQQYDALQEAWLNKESAWADYRKASQKLHQEMEQSVSFITSLTYLLYGKLGRKSPVLEFFGIRPHRKPGPKRHRTKKENPPQEATAPANE